MAEEKDNKKNSTMTIMMIGMFSFFITVVIAGTFLFMKFSAPTAAGNTGKYGGGEIGPLLPIGSEIIVNLAPSDTTGDHYLKVNITMEADGEKTVGELTKRIPQIRDLVIGILSSKTKDKIEEKEGKERIRREIIRVINSHLSLGRVRNIYFQDFVIQ